MSQNQDHKGRVEGWVHVWEMTCAVEKRILSKGRRHPKARWEPRFCVLMADLGTVKFYTSEQNESVDGEDDSSSTDEVYVTHTRLDGGRASFQRRWGYKTLEIIQEHSEKSLFASEFVDRGKLTGVVAGDVCHGLFAFLRNELRVF